jgi:hypothetical protein
MKRLRDMPRRLHVSTIVSSIAIRGLRLVAFSGDIAPDPIAGEIELYVTAVTGARFLPRMGMQTY